MGAGGCHFFFLSSAFCPQTACPCGVGTAEEVMREAEGAGVQNTSLGTHRFTMESLVCLMTVISTFIRYSRGRHGHLKTALGEILLCHEWRKTRKPVAIKYTEGFFCTPRKLQISKSPSTCTGKSSTGESVQSLAALAVPFLAQRQLLQQAMWATFFSQT